MKSGIDWGHIVLWLTGTVIPALGVAIETHQGAWTVSGVEQILFAALLGGGLTGAALAKRAPKDARDMKAGRLVYATPSAPAPDPGTGG